MLFFFIFEVEHCFKGYAVEIFTVVEPNWDNCLILEAGNETKRHQRAIYFQSIQMQCYANQMQFQL